MQFFDHDSLLPPPFTFLSILVLIFQLAADRRNKKGGGKHGKNPDNAIVGDGSMPSDQTYPTLIFSLLDSAKAKSDKDAAAKEKDKYRRERKMSHSQGHGSHPLDDT